MDVLPAGDRIVRARLAWMPWRVRYRKTQQIDLSDGLDLDLGDDPISWLIAVIVVIIFAVGGLGLLLFPIELVALLLVAVGLVVLRMVGVMPWLIVVEHADGRTHAESVRGVFPARRRLHELRGQISGL